MRNRIPPYSYLSHLYNTTYRLCRFRVGFFLLSVLLATAASALSATIVVPTDYSTIQAAIDAADPGDTVSVEAGTYVENIDFLGKAITVESANGAEVTVIDGSNINPVVRFQNNEGLSSIIDGFTLTNGLGHEVLHTTKRDTYEYYGGGIYCASNTSPTIQNNIITDNNKNIENSNYNYGGGICCFDQSYPVIIDNIITNNSLNINMISHSGGGGIYCGFESDVIIMGNHISENTGSGIYCYDYSNSYISNNTISNNTAYRRGGGIHINFISTSTILNNRITCNNVSAFGGGIYSEQSLVQIDNNYIVGNNGGGGLGGGIYICGGSGLQILRNNLVYNNRINGSGGGICLDYRIIVSFINNTVVGNISTDPTNGKGGGLCIRNCSVSISNSILWGNRACIGAQLSADLLYYNPKTVSVEYSDIEGGEEEVYKDVILPHEFIWDGATTITENPKFFYGNGGELLLPWDSPCIDAGDDTPWGPYPSATDLDGITRILGAQVDMGCYELKSPINVPGDYSNIQDAIDAAAFRDTILVDDGTYTENIDFSGKSITVMSLDGAESTIIDGNMSGSVVTFSAGNDRGSVLSGFTIKNGNGTLGSGIASLVGGGVYCETDSIQTICNNYIENNSSDAGGGLFCASGSTTNIGLNNIYQNQAISSHGAGAYIHNCPDVNISDNQIYENSATSHGGAVFLHDSDVTCCNNTIYSNDVIGRGAGIYFQNSSPLLFNHTITQNTAGISGGGLCVDSTSSPTIKNTILWDNSALAHPEVHSLAGSNPDIAYCNIKDNPGLGTNCISEYPYFFNPVDDDYHITMGSPCLDAGDPDLSDLPAADKDMQSRIFNTVDIGADEITVLNVPEDYSTIQEAIDAAYYKDTVLVAEGTYQESIDFKGKSIYVESAYGFKSTVLEGSQTASLVNFVTNETSEAVLNGFTILNGGGTDGAGIYCVGSSPTIINNLITDNFATDQGGGVYIEDGSPILNSNLITYNSADTTGGAIYCYASFFGLCSPKIINNTITGNSSSSGDGGIYGNSLSNPTIANTILWDDSPSEIGGSTINFTVTHCDIEGGFPSGTSIINVDPQFIGSSNSAGTWKQNDFHIEYNSPCKNSGTSSVPGLRKYDIDGNIITGDYDIGADEFDSYLYLTGNNYAGNSIKIVNVSEGLELDYILVGLNFLEEPIYLTNPPYDYEGWLYVDFITVIIPSTTLFPPSGVIEEDHDLPNTPVDPYKIVIQSVIDDKLINYAVMFIGKSKIEVGDIPLITK